MLKNRINILTPYILVLLVGAALLQGCVTKKRKKEVSKLSKFYHNVTSEYNGYFNANELYEFALIDLRASNNDNYTDIVSVYNYVTVDDPKMVNADMDKAIEKVNRVAALHEPGDWVDDCYVLMGKAQFLKQDYATAVETFEYFQEDFNPANPYGRNFQKKKLSSKQKNKLRKKEKKEREKARKKEREEREKARKEEREAKKKERSRSSKKRSKKRGKKKRPERKKEDQKTTPSTSTSTTTPTTNNTTSKPKQEENTKKNTPPKKEPKDETAYNEGLVWLAKSYNMAGRYTSAEFLLNRLDKKTLDAEVEYEKIVARADNLIKQGKEFEAIEFLDQAYDHKKASRDEKGRYAFVSGQINMKDGYYRDASSYFSLAKKKAKNPKMKFMAELNMLKCEELAGNKRINVERKLKKMLDETKYQEFHDEVYFALGELEINKNNLDEAKNYFSQAVAVSNGASLKTEAYYRLASITYGNEDYVVSKYYYDSTSMVIAKGDPRNREVNKRKDALKDIAKNIETIERLDSTIALADKSSEELMDIAKARLEKEKKTGKLTDTNIGNKTLIQNQRRNNARKRVNSSFWAYNIVLKETGKKSFIDKWGDRPLVDNWRNQSKINSSGQIADDENEEKDDASLVADSGISQEDYDRVMADVPKNALDKGKLDEQVSKAMFELGKQYRDRLQNYRLSALTLEQLIDRYPSHKGMKDAYYYLYLDYLDLDQPSLANKYKNLILEKDPDSDYAKLISDPNYATKLMEERKKVDKYYDRTYAIFQKGDYLEVNKRYDIAEKTFGKDNKLIAKFSLLNAMALGFTKGQEAYIDGLKQVIARYPKTPEELKAKEIMRLLKGDKAAFNDVDMKSVEEMFTYDENKRHFVAIILYDFSDEVLQPAKIAISDFNKKYFTKDRIQLGQSMLNKTEETQLVLCRSFSNAEKAMNYYNTIMKDKESYIPESLVLYDVLPISQKNYRTVLQQRTHTNYAAFFKKFYLGEE